MIFQLLITVAQMGPIDHILPPLTLGPQGPLVDEFSPPGLSLFAFQPKGWHCGMRGLLFYDCVQWC